jgi:lysozyme
MKVSENFVKLIESFEGYSPTFYYDSANLPTIGYGTYIDHNSEYLQGEIDRDMAFQLLKDEIYDIEYFINTVFHKLNITQNMYDALCSFVYYNGINNFKKSFLIRKILHNPRDYTIKGEFLKWIYMNGKRSTILVNRRKKEIELYFKQ